MSKYRVIKVEHYGNVYYRVDFGFLFLWFERSRHSTEDAAYTEYDMLTNKVGPYKETMICPVYY